MVNAQEVLNEAMSLSRAERSYLAERLLESLDDGRELSASWSEEISRRVARRESGEGLVFSRDEIRKEIEGIFSK